jgi:hypothetical protein
MTEQSAAGIPPHFLVTVILLAINILAFDHRFVKEQCSCYARLTLNHKETRSYVSQMRPVAPTVIRTFRPSYAARGMAGLLHMHLQKGSLH